MLFSQLIYSLFLSLLCSSSNINVAPFSAYKNTQPAIPKIILWLVCVYDFYPLIEVTGRITVKLPMVKLANATSPMCKIE